jgi:hypothetical protein
MQQMEIMAQLKRTMNAVGRAKQCVRGTRHGGDLLRELDTIDDAMDCIDELLKKTKKDSKAA